MPSGRSSEQASFKSLTVALENSFDRPLAELPGAPRRRVEQDFFPMPWDNLSANQRRSVALQWDYQNDPATAQERQFWWDFAMRRRELEMQIAQWAEVSTPTAGELVTKETRLAELRKELAHMELQQRQGRGDYYPEKKAARGRGHRR
jgi:hypothetical protein